MQIVTDASFRDVAVDVLALQKGDRTIFDIRTFSSGNVPVVSRLSAAWTLWSVKSHRNPSISGSDVL